MIEKTTISYGGELYRVARSAADVKAEVEAIYAEGRSGWLEVNYGEGRESKAFLHIHVGLPLAILPEKPADLSPVDDEPTEEWLH